MAFRDTKATGQSLTAAEYNALSDYLVMDMTSVAVNTDATVNNIYLVDATGGERTITLPTASLLPTDRIVVKKIDNSANDVIVDGDGNTIDGEATITISSQYESYDMYYSSTETEWYIL